MRVKLKQLADIKPGFTFRTAVDGKSGDYRLLRIQDIRAPEHGKKRPDRVLVNWDNKKSPPQILPGDIVLPGRGERYYAMYFEEANMAQFAGDGARGIIPGNQIYVIRLWCGIKIETRVLPQYLAWFLNRSESLKYYAAHLRGTSIPILSRSNLELMEIKVPALETQKKILTLDQSWQEENRLSAELLENRCKMLTGIYQHYLKEDVTDR